MTYAFPTRRSSDLRARILSGVTKERHAKVSFASQPNMQTWAIAKTLGVRAGLRQACLHDGHQLARLAAAMTETLALAIPELPGLADDKQIGRASCRERVCQNV